MELLINSLKEFLNLGIQTILSLSNSEQHKKRSLWAYLGFALALLLLFYCFDEGENLRYSQKFFRQAKVLNGVIYFGWFVGSALVFISWLFVRSGFWRFIAFLILGITFFFECAGHWIAGEGVSYHGILQIEQNRGFSLDTQVWDSFGNQFLLTGLLTICLLAVIVYIQKKWLSFRIRHWVMYVLPIITFLGGYGIIKKTQANRTDFPFPYKVIDVYAYAKLNSIYLGDRQPVSETPTAPFVIDHIVLIVDESIRGDYLSINQYAENVTPFLQQSDSLIINYGVAASAGVCSNYSNIILISGANQNELPDEPQLTLQKPNIFQFAKKANFEPHLLYSVGYPDRPSGFWSDSDMTTARNKWFVREQYPEVKAYNRDRRALNILEKIIAEESSFTYLLKYGAHFHCENSYPKDQRHFEPTQAVGDWDKNNRKELINSYKNALRWNVDEFFKLIEEKFRDENILFVYTSDHGQNLLDIEKMKLTHCAKGIAPPVMATVPIFLYSPNPEVVEKIKTNYYPESLDHASHFNIFPTILTLFGYDQGWIRDNYDPSLFENLEKEKRRFSSGDIFGRSTMYWNDFD